MYEKDVAQVMEELGAVETGLRCEEVAERQNTYGGSKAGASVYRLPFSV